MNSPPADAILSSHVLQLLHTYLGDTLARFNFLATYAQCLELQNRDLNQQNSVLARLKVQPPKPIPHKKVTESEKKSVGTTTENHSDEGLIPDQNNNLTTADKNETPVDAPPILDCHQVDSLKVLENLCREIHEKLDNLEHKWSSSATALQENLLHIRQEVAIQTQQIARLLSAKELGKNADSPELEIPIAESSRVHSPRGGEKKGNKFLIGDDKSVPLATPHRTLRHLVDHSFYHDLSSIERSRRVTGDEVQSERCRSSRDICPTDKVTQQSRLVQNNSLPWSSEVGPHWMAPPRLSATWVDFDVDSPVAPDCPAVDTFSGVNKTNSSSLCRTLHRPRCDCSRHEKQLVSSRNASSSSMQSSCPTVNASCQAVYGHSWDVLSEVTLSAFDEDELDFLLEQTLSHYF